MSADNTATPAGPLNLLMTSFVAYSHWWLNLVRPLEFHSFCADKWIRRWMPKIHIVAWCVPFWKCLCPGYVCPSCSLQKAGSLGWFQKTTNTWTFPESSVNKHLLWYNEPHLARQIEQISDAVGYFQLSSESWLSWGCDGREKAARETVRFWIICFSLRHAIICTFHSKMSHKTKTKQKTWNKMLVCRRNSSIKRACHGMSSSRILFMWWRRALLKATRPTTTQVDMDRFTRYFRWIVFAKFERTTKRQWFTFFSGKRNENLQTRGKHQVHRCTQDPTATHSFCLNPKEGKCA